jgi:annexin A7/11
MGTDEKKIIRVTCAHNQQQRLKIAETFRKEYKRDLLDDLRSELGGKLEKILVPLYLPPGAFDAQLMKEAMDGIGYNTDKMVEVLCTRTNEELKAMAAQWKDKESLQDRVADETKKLFGANSLQTLMLAILRADRPPNGPVDQASAERDATMLANKMKKSSKRGKKRMVEVFTTRSWTQIAAISKKYENASKEYTMRAAIEEGFGDSDTGKALMAIEEFSVQPYDFWAKKLHAALKGMGSDEETLIRILVSRAEVDLDNVRTIFGQRYGDGKTLIKWMEGDVGGDFGLALVGLLGGEV